MEVINIDDEKKAVYLTKIWSLTETPIRNNYRNMIRRCYDPKCSGYEYYGGKGVTVCDEWLGEKGLLHFHLWAMFNGYKKGLTIDRIDPCGNYEPKNCRWVTRKEQDLNKTNTVMVNLCGVLVPLRKLVDFHGVDYKRVYDRVVRRNEDLFSVMTNEWAHHTKHDLE